MIAAMRASRRGTGLLLALQLTLILSGCGASGAASSDDAGPPGDTLADAPVDAVDAAGDREDPPFDSAARDSAGLPDGVGGSYKAIAIATGDSHTCALLDDHNVKCWGLAANGALGYEDTRDRGGAPEDMGDALPLVDLGTGRSAVTVAGGHYTTCAILDEGSVKCWGWGGLNGQSAPVNVGSQPGDMGDHLRPLDFGGRHAVHVAIARNEACASMDDDTLWCWSGGAPHMLDVGHTPKVSNLFQSGLRVGVSFRDGAAAIIEKSGTLTPIAFDRPVVVVAGADGKPTCAILDDGTTACLDAGDVKRADFAPSDAIGIGVAESGSICVLRAHGAVECAGQIGCGAPAAMRPYWCQGEGPTIALGQPAVAITSGGLGTTCALLADGGIKCWGSNPAFAPSEWLGAEVSYRQSDSGITYGSWHSVDLGMR